MSHYSTSFLPSEQCLKIARQARSLRLKLGLKQNSLATQAGISLSSLKRFEANGEISLLRLLKIAHVLNCMDDFMQLFDERQTTSIAELEKRTQAKQRERGNL